MKFRFEVNLNDNDYLEYNKFLMLRSHYGKNQIQSMRIFVLILFALGALYVLYKGGFSLSAFIGLIPLAIFMVVFQLLLKPLFAMTIKFQIKTLKKSGKMGYDASAVLEFYEDSFVEIAPEKKTELNYSLIERISVVDNNMIYLHTSNVGAYILPIFCFETKEQYDGFFEFIRRKCANIDFY